MLDALRDLGLELRLRNLLTRLGYPADAPDPDAVTRLFVGRQHPLHGPLVDDLPLSETATVRAWTDDGRNYLAWLEANARTALDVVRTESGFTAATAPVAVLYLLLRHAVLEAYAEAALRLAAAAHALSDADVVRARREQPFVHVSERTQVTESRFGRLYSPDQAVTGDPAMLVADFIPGIIGRQPAAQDLSRAARRHRRAREGAHGAPRTCARGAPRLRDLPAGRVAARSRHGEALPAALPAGGGAGRTRGRRHPHRRLRLAGGGAAPRRHPDAGDAHGRARRRVHAARCPAAHARPHQPGIHPCALARAGEHRRAPAQRLPRGRLPGEPGHPRGQPQLGARADRTDLPRRHPRRPVPRRAARVPAGTRPARPARDRRDRPVHRRPPAGLPARRRQAARDLRACGDRHRVPRGAQRRRRARAASAT